MLSLSCVCLPKKIFLLKNQYVNSERLASSRFTSRDLVIFDLTYLAKAGLHFHIWRMRCGEWPLVSTDDVTVSPRASLSTWRRRTVDTSLYKVAPTFNRRQFRY